MLLIYAAILVASVLSQNMTGSVLLGGIVLDGRTIDYVPDVVVIIRNSNVNHGEGVTDFEGRFKNPTPFGEYEY